MPKTKYRGMSVNNRAKTINQGMSGMKVVKNKPHNSKKYA